MHPILREVGTRAPQYQSLLLLPFLQATIHYKSQAKSYRITPTRRRICRPLIRSNFQSFSNKCAQNLTTRKALIKTISQLLRGEVATMCSDKFPSLLRNKSKEALMKFDFNAVMMELGSHAPILLTLLKSCLKTKKTRPNEDLIIMVISAIICKHRRSSCSLMQRMTSLILYAGHSAKQV